LTPAGSAVENGDALDRALAALGESGGGTLDIGDGVFKLPGNHRVYANTWVRMSAGTVLDISEAGAVSALIADGLEGSLMPLVADGNRGATSITLSSENAATLAQGDWVRVASNAVFDASSTSSELGELIEVKSVAGGSVTLETPLCDTYTTVASGAVTKITFVDGIRISGGKILGGGTLTAAGSDADCNGIRVFLGRNTVIEQVRMERCDLSGVWLRDCVFYKVIACDFRDAVNDQQAYGVLLDNACQDGEVIGITGARVRHLFTTGNSTATRGITRRFTVSHAHCYSTTPARGGAGGDAFDTHTAAEHGKFSKCVSHYSTGAGFNIECPSMTLEDCESHYATEEGFALHNESDREATYQLINCRALRSGAEGFRLTCPTRGATASVRSAELTNCRAEDSVGNGLYVANTIANGAVVRGLTTKSFKVTGCQSANASVWLQNLSGADIDVSVAEPTQAGANLVRIRDSVDWKFSGSLRHMASSSSAICLYVNSSTAGACQRGLVSGVAGGGTTPTNLRGLFADTNAQNLRVGDVDFQGCNTPLDLQLGTGHRVQQQSGVSSDNGDTSPTLTVNSLQTQRFNTPLTTNRTVTAPSASLASGLRFRVVREAGATGGSTLTAFGKALTVGQWADGECDGSSYRLVAFGSL
jgi:hypothetical protein